jgi:hypothetical protein
MAQSGHPAADFFSFTYMDAKTGKILFGLWPHVFVDGEQEKTECDSMQVDSWKKTYLEPEDKI